MSFFNKVVIVTGASAGIGAAIAIQLAKERAKVVLVGRNEDRLYNVSQQCQEIGAEYLAIKADLMKDSDIKIIIEKTVNKFEKIDVLINNAAMLLEMNFLDNAFVESFDEIMHMNLRSVVKLTWLATPHIIKTKGNIVNISSISGTKVKIQNFIAMSTSKAALDNFSYTLAMELAPHGVRVNVVSPGPVRTDVYKTAGLNINVEDLKHLTALQRISESSEIADLVMLVASDKAKSMTGSKYFNDNGILLMDSHKKI